MLDGSAFVDATIVEGYAQKITLPKIVEPDGDLFAMQVFGTRISKPQEGPVSILEPGAVDGTSLDFISSQGLKVQDDGQLSFWSRPTKKSIGKYLITFMFSELITEE